MMHQLQNAFILLIIIAIVPANMAVSKLQIREFDPEGDTIGLECREDFFNGQIPTTLHDINLFLYNETGGRVVSLLVSEGITYEFDSEADGQLRFEVQQSIEGYYYCSRNASEGLPSPTNYKTLLARPKSREVKTTYLERVGDSVIMESGVGEGKLGAHYEAIFYKNSYNNIMPYTNVSRGEDFSLIISSVQLGDSGIYEPVVLIDIGNGLNYVIEPTNRISLKVYESPIIELPPQSVVVDEEAVKGGNVSFTCFVTGAPSLRVSWFLEDKNLTGPTQLDSRFSSETLPATEAGVISKLVINSPTYEDNGQYVCVATILNDQSGDERFITQESATLTVLESDFYLKVVVTENQQLQLWVELEVPLHFPVTAVAYLTLESDMEYQVSVPTRSVLTNNTVMVFQLESHDIPERFRDNEFYVQVSLKVGTTESSLVPDSLGLASTANLGKPTEDYDCGREETYRQVIVISAAASVCFALFMLLATFGFICCYCKRQKLHSTERTVKHGKMTEGLRISLNERLTALYDKLFKEKNKGTKKEIHTNIQNIQGQLRGECPESTEITNEEANA